MTLVSFWRGAPREPAAAGACSCSGQPTPSVGSAELVHAESSEGTARRQSWRSSSSSSEMWWCSAEVSPWALEACQGPFSGRRGKMPIKHHRRSLGKTQTCLTNWLKDQVNWWFQEQFWFDCHCLGTFPFSFLFFSFLYSYRHSYCGTQFK